MRERDLTNSGSDEENEREGWDEETRGRGKKREEEEEERSRKITRTGGIGREMRETREIEERAYVEAEARTAEVKRNDNGRKSGGHRWMKKQKDIDDGG